MKKSHLLFCLLFLAIAFPGSGQNEDFNSRQVKCNLSQPWEIIYGPDNQLWVTESRAYRLVRVNPNTGSTQVVLDASGLKNFGQNQWPWPQGGFTGLALHPDLLTGKPYVYLGYVYQFDQCLGNAGGCFFKTKVVRYNYNIASGTLSNEQVLINSINGSNDHNGGRMTIGEINDIPYLFFSVGDMGAGQFDNAERAHNAQDTDIYEGKVLRFNLEPDADANVADQWIPNDNPFNNSQQNAVWTYGHRNPQGLVIGSNGIFYSAEHGPFSDDEVNILEKGSNYGFPLIAGPAGDGNYNGIKVGTGSTVPLIVSEQNNAAALGSAYRDPLQSFYPASQSELATIYSNEVNNTPPFPSYYLSWPSMAPSGIDFYGSDAIPGWQNSILIASLKRATLFRVKLSADGQSIVSDTIGYFKGQGRFRDIAISPDGNKIFVVCDSLGQTSGPTQGSATTPINRGCIMEFEYQAPASGITLNCPSDLTFQETAGSTLTLVDWALPTGSTNCPSGGLVISQTGGPTPGSELVDGNYPITYTATDNCGNTTSCTFNVLINPFFAFININCPSDITLQATSPDGAIATWDDPIITTDCPFGFSLNQVFGSPSGSLFPIGTHEIIYVANLGNPGAGCTAVAECNFFITVSDPNAACPPSLSGFTVLGEYNNHKYFLSDNSLPWTQARASAVSNNGYLASINDAAENDFLNNAVGNAIVFIGLNDAASEGSLAWDSGEALTYNNLSANNSASADYGTLLFWDGSWALESELVWRPYIVEIPCGAGPSEITLNCPADLTFQESAGNTMTVIDWNVPTANSNCLSGGIVVTQTSGPNPGAAVPDGDYLISYEASDNCGNTASCSFNVAVQPFFASLTITCPSDISLPATSPDGAIVTWVDPVVTTDCPFGFNLNQVFGLPSGSLFPIGTHEIIYVANLGSPGAGCTAVAECSFFITVTDPGGACPPAIPGFTVLGEYNNHKYFLSDNSLPWPQAQANASSNNGYLASINDAAENDFLNNAVGNTIVFIGFNDAASEGDFAWDSGEALTYNNLNANNTASADYGTLQFWNGTWGLESELVWRPYILEVPCGGGPLDLSINCPGDLSFQETAGNTLTVIDWTIPSSVGNCPSGGITVTQTSGPSPGTAVPDGDYVISYEATDNCGNTATCSFNVTVQPFFASLTIICPNDISIPATSPDGAIVTWVDPVVTTDCPFGFNLNQVFGSPSGSLFPIGTYEIIYVANLGSPGAGCTAVAECSFFITVTDPGGTCPPAIPGFTVLGEYNNHKYFLSDHSLPWPQAQASANSNNAYLATINDAAENDFLNNAIGNTVVFIGLNDVASEGNLVWENGDPLTYNNLSATNTASADYGTLLFWNGTWGLESELVWRPYVLEVPCGNGPVYELTVDCPDTIIATGFLNPSNGAIENPSWSNPTGSTTCPGGMVTTTLVTQLPIIYFQNQTYPLSFSISDTCGNEVICNTILQPVANMGGLFIDIICPADITIEVPQGSTGGNVSWSESDIQVIIGSACNIVNGSQFPFQIAGPANGAFFPIGSTQVGYAVSPFCSNLPPGFPFSDECFFTVSVEETNGGNPCPATLTGYTSLGEFNNHAYFLSDASSPWLYARDSAQSAGAYLAAINDAAENEFLRNALGTTIAFTGLNDAAIEGVLAWENGDPLTYNNAGGGNTEDQDFGVLFFWDGSWGFENAQVWRQHILEVECVTTSPPSSKQGGATESVNKTLEVLNIFPNPVEDVLTIVLQSQIEQTSHLEVYNAMGQIRWTQKIDMASDLNAISLEVKNWTSGFYYLRISGESFRDIQVPFVKQND